MRELCAWYALTVKHQHEVAARSALEFRGFEALAPTYRARRRWADRVKQIDLPLFAGYVFCRFAFAERVRVIEVPGVARVVEFGGSPAEISEAEIAVIRIAMASKLAVRPWPYLKPGDRVRVQHGPLRGIEGTLLREEPDRLQLVIGIEMLQRSLAVEVEADMVTPVQARWAVA
jgi:transcription antitermination factor NusG